MATKSLPVDVRERVSALLERIVRDDFGGNQSETARQLGVSQAFISEVVKRRRGPGQTLLSALATYTGKSMDELLGRPLPRGPSVTAATDPLPERAAALAPFESDPDPIVQTAIRKTRALAFGGHRNRSTIEWTKRFLLEIELAREPFDEARNDAEVQALSDLVERNKRR